jgi:hypothetical protein
MKRLLLAAVAFACGACARELPRERIERDAQSLLSHQLGRSVPRVTCPSGVELRDGASVLCGVELDGAHRGALVTVIGARNAVIGVGLQ